MIYLGNYRDAREGETHEDEGVTKSAVNIVDLLCKGRTIVASIVYQYFEAIVILLPLSVSDLSQEHYS